MKVIFFSPNFLPLIGGLENVMRDWAFGLTEFGHKVQVITLTPNEDPDNFPFEVFRNVGQFKMWKLMCKADVVVQFNVSLKGILPSVLSFRPLIISHHGTNRNIDGKWVRYGKLKQFIANYIARANTACSHYIASFLNEGTVIHSPYDPAVFKLIAPVERNKELVFLGRLVSDKGCGVLIRALGILKKRYGMCPVLTIIGDGPEKEKLMNLTEEEAVSNQVIFAGMKSGKELAETLNNHKILVVPSVWEEPFGIVALEGLACGCKLVVSNAGGLPEAVGAFGMMFKKGDAVDLSTVLNKIFQSEKNEVPNVAAITTHLNNFTVKASVMKLIKVLNGVI